MLTWDQIVIWILGSVLFASVIEWLYERDCKKRGYEPSDIFW